MLPHDIPARVTVVSGPADRNKAVQVQSSNIWDLNYCCTIKQPSLALRSHSKLAVQRLEWKNSLLVRSDCSIQGRKKGSLLLK